MRARSTSLAIVFAGVAFTGACGDGAAGGPSATSGAAGGTPGDGGEAASPGDELYCDAALGNVVALASTGEDLYWLEEGQPEGQQYPHGRVWRLALAGGGASAPVTIASEQDRVAELAADDAHVYWAANGTIGNTAPDALLMVAPRDGGAPSILASGVQDVAAIVVDASGGYVAVQDTGVLTFPPGGGTDAPTLLTQEYAPNLATDAARVYLGSFDGVRAVAKPGHGDTTVVTVESSSSAILGVAVDNGVVYWLASSGVPPKPALMALPAGTTTPRLVAELPATAAGLKVRGAAAFWTEQPELGKAARVVTMPADGGTPAVVSSGGGFAFAVDDSAVYVADGRCIYRAQR